MLCISQRYHSEVSEAGACEIFEYYVFSIEKSADDRNCLDIKTCEKTPVKLFKCAFNKSGSVLLKLLS